VIPQADLVILHRTLRRRSKLKLTYRQRATYLHRDRSRPAGIGILAGTVIVVVALTWGLNKLHARGGEPLWPMAAAVLWVIAACMAFAAVVMIIRNTTTECRIEAGRLSIEPPPGGRITDINLKHVEEMIAVFDPKHGDVKHYEFVLKDGESTMLYGSEVGRRHPEQFRLAVLTANPKIRYSNR
jgi:hypothetical protein